jgi:hypothetical protein
MKLVKSILLWNRSLRQAIKERSALALAASSYRRPIGVATWRIATKRPAPQRGTGLFAKAR